MKALTHPVSRSKAIWRVYSAPAAVARALAVMGFAVSAAASTPHTPPCVDLGQPGAYPTFCSVPAAPSDVRTAEAYKTAVIAVRLEGRRVARQSAPDTFTLPLGGAAAFAADARAAAANPAAGPVPTRAESDAFAVGARNVASPPKRHRR
jgi:hypothetical protein